MTEEATGPPQLGQTCGFIARSYFALFTFGLLRIFTGYPTYVENDGTSGGYAGWFTNSGKQNMAYLSLENGVSGAILFNGAPYIGDNHRSSEFAKCVWNRGDWPASAGVTGAWRRTAPRAASATTWASHCRSFSTAFGGLQQGGRCFFGIVLKR